MSSEMVRQCCKAAGPPVILLPAVDQQRPKRSTLVRKTHQHKNQEVDTTSTNVLSKREVVDGLIQRDKRSWAVLQKRTGEHDGREAPLLFSLGGHSKQAGDERDLPYDILLFDTSHL